MAQDPGESTDHQQAMDRFLASVEGRAFVMAEIATRNPDDALDLVQDAMPAFARSYSSRRPGGSCCGGACSLCLADCPW